MAKYKNKDFGLFRVGKYFVVDQSTGSITFAGDVGISRAASLGFKDGEKYKKTGKAGIFAGSLELVKEGNLTIKQENLYDEIYIKENKWKKLKKFLEKIL